MCWRTRRTSLVLREAECRRHEGCGKRAVRSSTDGIPHPLYWAAIAAGAARRLLAAVFLFRLADAIGTLSTFVGE